MMWEPPEEMDYLYPNVTLPEAWFKIHMQWPRLIASKHSQTGMERTESKFSDMINKGVFWRKPTSKFIYKG